MKFSSIALALSAGAVAYASNYTTTNTTGGASGSSIAPTGTATTIPTAGASANQVGSLLVVVGAAAVYFL
ncbi:hypothetical protein SEPCBS119000_002579 [Sporothrix epigloea]|uniref:Uncharacterized protein n=1 Tax=Sporothrix epigloea TaxID=1892477 RepID=A0ABP0DKE7_9PEZI